MAAPSLYSTKETAQLGTKQFYNNRLVAKDAREGVFGKNVRVWISKSIMELRQRRSGRCTCDTRSAGEDLTFKCRASGVWRREPCVPGAQLRVDPWYRPNRPR